MMRHLLQQWCPTPNTAHVPFAATPATHFNTYANANRMHMSASYSSLCCRWRAILPSSDEPLVAQCARCAATNPWYHLPDALTLRARVGLL